jgi:hypothetical protein
MRLRGPLSSAWLLVACGLLTACPPDDDSPPGDDTGSPPDTELECPEGEIQDGDVCVPEACGTGAWGDLVLPEGTLHVDALAAEGGDGSAEAPFASIGEALAVAGPGATVAVAAGSYPETISIGASLGGLHLAGRCRELVAIDASVGDSSTPGVRIEAAAGAVTLSDLSVREAWYAGLMITSGQVSLQRVGVYANGYSGMGVVANSMQAASVVAEDCDFAENVGVNVGLFFSRAELTLRNSVVRDGARGGLGQNGLGISVDEGASLVLESSQVLRNHNQGIVVEAGSRVELRGSLIEGNLPDPGGLYGYGLQIEDSEVSIDGSELVGNHHAGLIASGDSVLTIRNSSIRDTLTTDMGSFGGAIQVGDGATLELDRCELSNNFSFGLTLTDGARATVFDTEILDTKENGLGEALAALWAQGGSQLEVRNVTIDGATSNGIYAAEEGTSATVSDTLIRGVRTDGSAMWGNALTAGWGASITATGVTIEDTVGVGVQASDPGTLVTLSDSSITNTQRGERLTVALGMVATLGGRLEASQVEVLGSEGPGLMAIYEESSLACLDCLVSGSEFAGAAVLGAAELELDTVTVQQTDSGSNVGGGVGIYADPWSWGEPTLDVVDSEVVDNPIAGLWLTGQGRYRVSDSLLHGGEGETRGSLQRCGDAVYARQGVTAWDGALGLELAGNTILDGRGAGLFLDGASATVAGNTWRDNLVDVIAQGEACEQEPDGLSGESIGSVELCPTWDYSTCTDTFQLLLSLESPETM